jgi:hypothetical protein
MSSTKSRESIWGGRVRAAKMNAGHARQLARAAAREADRAEAHAWSLRMEGYGGPAQPSPTIGQCLNGGFGWLESNASLYDASELTRGCDPPSPTHPAMEA